MKKLVLTSLLLCAFTVCFAERVHLPKGTVVTVKFMDDASSKGSYIPTVLIAGDVYDADGYYILIKKDTSVDIQFNAVKGSVWGDVGRLEVTPISTTAFNGRLIAFETEPVVFSGNDSFSGKRMQAKVTKGTTFRAVIANDYYFNIDAE